MSVSNQSRPLSLLPVLVVGLCALVAVQLAWRDPRYLAAFGALGVTADF